jgi:hypothetical protein
VEEGTAGSAGHPDDDDGGFGGVAGYGAYGGAYGGDYGGAYGGYGGDYGGVTYGGAYGGDYGGAYGGYGGDVAGSYITGGAFPTGGYGGVTTGGYGGTITGGYGGTYGGTAGVTGKGGCGAASGSGGGKGSPSLGKACALFCPTYPYASCPSDFEGPRDCLAKCQNGFGLGSWCQAELVNFLVCASNYLDPNAMCIVQGDQCYGPGCTVDAINSCATEYIDLLECQDSPRPLPPCPPPPNRPLPPNCSQGASVGPDYCARETACPNVDYKTECYPQYDDIGSWICNCSTNGVYLGSVVAGPSMDACAAGALLCGYY